MAGRIPHWVMVAVPAVVLTILGTAYVTAPDMEGRADECLGNTAPIQRGVMVNRCDHAISVLTCPQGAAESDCRARDVAAAKTFEVRADIPVIAHACTDPYTAVMLGGSDDGARRCRAAE